MSLRHVCLLWVLGAAPVAEATSKSGVKLAYRVEPKRAFAGEQIRVELVLSSPSKRRISIAAMDDIPNVEGAWKEILHLPKRLRPKKVVRNRQPTDEFVLWRIALFAHGSGSLRLPPTWIKVRRERGVLFKGRLQTVEAKAETIRIADLPRKQKPPEFHPANVGSFRLFSNLSKGQTRTGEAVTLKITLEGDGNLKTISFSPNLSVNELEASPPQTSRVQSSSKKTLQGKLVHELLLIPQTPGNFRLGPFQVATFHPKTRAYKILRTEEHFLNVTGAPLPRNPTRDNQVRTADARLHPRARPEPDNPGHISATAIEWLNSTETTYEPFKVRPWMIAFLILVPTCAFALRALLDRFRKKKRTRSVPKIQSAEDFQREFHRSASEVLGFSTQALTIQEVLEQLRVRTSAKPKWLNELEGALQVLNHQKYTGQAFASVPSKRWRQLLSQFAKLS